MLKTLFLLLPHENTHLPSFLKKVLMFDCFLFLMLSSDEIGALELHLLETQEMLFEKSLKQPANVVVVLNIQFLL